MPSGFVVTRNRRFLRPSATEQPQASAAIRGHLLQRRAGDQGQRPPPVGVQDDRPREEPPQAQVTPPRERQQGPPPGEEELQRAEVPQVEAEVLDQAPPPVARERRVIRRPRRLIEEM